MKCINPEIAWHNREPVFSVDIQKEPISINDNETVYRLASGGGDYHVVVWHVKVKSDGLPTFEIAADLNRHQKAVNVVRFSPSGEYLASGDDEGVIMVWRQKAGGVATSEQLFEEVSGCENWVVAKILRGHLGDVYDMCWSPDSKHLISGSIDNKAILWNAADGKYQHIFQDHKGFVQGVAWDPKNKYFATLASDRFCRFFRTVDNKPVARALKTAAPGGDNSKPEENDKCYLFHDDTFKSFFRRLTFTPDGNLVIAPSGIIDEKQEEEPTPVVEEDEDIQCETPKPKAKRKPKFAGAIHLFSRFSLKKPCLTVPLGYDKYCVAVRCCPVMFEHLNKNDESADDKEPPMVSMPYRVVFAVATQDSVLLFDTKQQLPIGRITAIHYTGITDLAWSSDGRALIISSTDGYCSIITFKPGELGVPVQTITPAVTTPETNAEVTKCVEVPAAVPTVVCPVVDEETEDIKLVLEDTIDNVQQVKESIPQEQDTIDKVQQVKESIPQEPDTIDKVQQVKESIPQDPDTIDKVQQVKESIPQEPDTIDKVQQVEESIPQEPVEKMDIDDSEKAPVENKIESPKVKSDVGSPLRGTGRRVQLITLSSPKKKKA